MLVADNLNKACKDLVTGYIFTLKFLTVMDVRIVSAHPYCARRFTRHDMHERAR